MAYIEKSEEICNFHLSNLRKSAFESAANCAMESVSPRTAGAAYSNANQATAVRV